MELPKWLRPDHWKFSLQNYIVNARIMSKALTTWFSGFTSVSLRMTFYPKPQKESIFVGVTISKLSVDSLLRYVEEDCFLDFNFSEYKKVEIFGSVAIVSIVKNCFKG